MTDDISKMLDERKAQNEEEVGAEKWAPEAGEMKTCAIQKIGWYDGSTEYAPSMFILVKDFDSDATVRVYTSTVLKGQLLEEAPAIGQPLAIRYEGKVQGKSRKYHSWTLVLVPDENGNVKRDHKLWQEQGVYRGTQPERQTMTDDGDSFF